MSIEPFEITTVYADGRTETRMSTPEEIAQREADQAAFEAQHLAQQQAQAEYQAKRQSARNKFAALGLTEDEINLLVP